MVPGANAIVEAGFVVDGARGVVEPEADAAAAGSMGSPGCPVEAVEPPQAMSKKGTARSRRRVKFMGLA
jgi:hypothetical protein